MITRVASFIPPFRFLGFFVSSLVAGRGCKIPLPEFLLLCRPHLAVRVPTRVVTRLFARYRSRVLSNTHGTHRALPFVQCALLRPRQDALFVARPFPVDPSRTVPPWTGISTPLLVHPTWDGSRSRSWFLSTRFRPGSTFDLIGGTFGSDPSTTTVGQLGQAHRRCNKKRCARNNTRRIVLEGSREAAGRWKGLEKAHATPRMHSERG